MTFPIVVLAVLWYLGIAGAQGQPRVVKLPPTWVPFSSDVVTTQPGYPPSEGRFYRGSDGSERLEIASGPVIYAQIKNIGQRTFYHLKGGADHWTAQPMMLPPEGWLPLPEIAESAQTGRQPERVEGMTAYRQNRLHGWWVVAIPDLNFFDVESHFGDGKTARHFNITIGEPDPSLFVPPPGVKIVQITEPGGIVFTPDPVPVDEQIDQYKKRHPEQR